MNKSINRLQRNVHSLMIHLKISLQTFIYCNLGNITTKQNEVSIVVVQ